SDPIVAGVTTIELVIVDSSSDPVDILSVELSPSGNFAVDGVTLAAADFGGTPLTNLSTSPTGDHHTLTWNSADAPFIAPGAGLRVTVRDHCGTPPDDCSLISQPVT